MLLYCDTSALAKLVRDEVGSVDFRLLVARYPSMVSSELIRTELMRALSRPMAELVEATRGVLDLVAQIPVTARVLDDAGRLPPTGLRSLDAIHLASALVVRAELTTFVSYDRQLLAAASALGLPVASPGLP